MRWRLSSFVFHAHWSAAREQMKASLRYRVRSRTALVEKGEAPKLEVEILEGHAKLSV
jgi:hypothetical protein